MNDRALPVLDNPETRLIRERYDRIAPFYDALEWMMEMRARGWRRDLWSRIVPGRVLELGAGTGKNVRYYPAGRDITAMDISDNMLERARARAGALGAKVQFEVGDVQAMNYPDDSFDVVIATFLFCSVPDPALGLKEARRVLKPGGQLLLLEHVLSHWPVLRQLMNAFDPIPFRIWGSHINRNTLEQVRDAGFVAITSENLSLDVFKRIEARAPGVYRANEAWGAQER